MSIVLCRIDDRLIHGQVVIGWGRAMAITSRWKTVGWVGFWLAIGLLCAYYLNQTINYRFITPGRLGPTLLDKQLWFWVHLLFALPVLIGAPLQFWTRLRTTRPRIHRAVGKTYVIGATVAGLTALYLGATIEYEGSRLPLIMLAATIIGSIVVCGRAACPPCPNMSI